MGLGSGINLFLIPDPGPGVKKAPDPGSGSATLLKWQRTAGEGWEAQAVRKVTYRVRAVLTPVF
jgi:hypothetical protein